MKNLKTITSIALTATALLASATTMASPVAQRHCDTLKLNLPGQSATTSCKWNKNEDRDLQLKVVLPNHFLPKGKAPTINFSCQFTGTNTLKSIVGKQNFYLNKPLYPNISKAGTINFKYRYTKGDQEGNVLFYLDNAPSSSKKFAFDAVHCEATWLKATTN